MVDVLTDGLERAHIAASLATSRGADPVVLTFINSGHPETQQGEAGMQPQLATFCRAKTVMLRCRGSSSASGIARWSSDRMEAAG